MSELNPILFFIGFVVGVAVGGIGGHKEGSRSVRTELIKSGHAEYVAGENGEPIWRMKEVGNE